jgi:hypothetical protein
MANRVAQQQQPRIGAIQRPRGRSRLPPECKADFKAWFDAHFPNRYPTHPEFEELIQRWWLSEQQASAFFANLRARSPKPPGDIKAASAQFSPIRKRRTQPKAQ